MGQSALIFALLMKSLLGADQPRITSVQSSSNAAKTSSSSGQTSAAIQSQPFPSFPMQRLDVFNESLFGQVRGAVGMPVQRMITTQPRISLKRTLVRCNQCMKGKLVDYTHNHGVDNRFPSTILGEKRDLYVYLPPGYDPCKQYPLIVWLHGAFGDEHAFIDGGRFDELEKLMACGKFPHAVMVCPDGTYEGKNQLTSQHSFYINGAGGAYEDFLMLEILPWIESEFNIKQSRESRAIFGISGGGFGAVSLGIRRRDYFSTVAALAAPVNMRYQNCKDRYFAPFNPATYRWNEDYDPKRVVGKFFGGLFRIKAKPLLEHVFGPIDQISDHIKEVNPADLLFTTDLKPGELNIFLHYPGKDNFNFDAHAKSFIWLASGKGIQVDSDSEPNAHHLVKYFRKNIVKAYLYIGQHLENAACTSAIPSTAVPQVSAR